MLKIFMSGSSCVTLLLPFHPGEERKQSLSLLGIVTKNKSVFLVPILERRVNDRAALMAGSGGEG